jgi:integrase
MELSASQLCDARGCARVERAESRPMTPEEARQFLDAMKDDRLEALYSVAIAPGLRQRETLGLLWPDIDLVRGTLTVQRSLQRIDGKLKLVEPKTARRRRTINLPQVAINSLLAHRARQQREQLIAGNA